MMWTRRGALAAAGAMGAVGPALAAEPGRSFKFRMRSNKLLTNLYFDRKGPLEALIDSGANVFCVQEQAAIKLALPTAGQSTATSATKVAATQLYHSKEVIIGETFLMRDVSLAALAMSTRPGHHSAILPLTGLGPTLTNFIDRTITVYKPSEKPPAELEVAKASTISSWAAQRLMVQATLDGQPVKLMVDTGAEPALYLQADFVRKAGLWDHYKSARDQTYVTATGLARGRNANAESVQFAGFDFKGVPVLMADPAGADQDGTVAYDGVLGVEVLRRMDLWMDGLKTRLAFRRNADFDQIWRRDRCGANFGYVSATDNGLRVTRVLPGSPAEKAGLMVGDRVLGFTGGGTLDELSHLMMGPPGAVATLKLSRDGAEQTMRIVLEDLV